MAAIKLKKLADKVRRGQRGRVEAGFSAGGRVYGYKVVLALDADGGDARTARDRSDRGGKSTAAGNGVQLR